MPGLIFEGDTTKRFGEKFPKPFIQEMRIFDTHIEADIVLYFKISLEEDVQAFVGNLSGYDLYSGFGNIASRDSLAEFVSVDEEIFNSEGERFIKLMLEKRIDSGSELSILNEEIFVRAPHAAAGGSHAANALRYDAPPDYGVIDRPPASANRGERDDEGLDPATAAVVAAAPVVSGYAAATAVVAGTTATAAATAVVAGTTATAAAAPTAATATTAADLRRDVVAASTAAAARAPRAADSRYSASPEGRESSRPRATPASARAARTQAPQKYFYCCTTLKIDKSSNLKSIQDLTNIDPTGGYNQIANSSSPLIYERIFKLGGALSTDPVDAYQETDGNIYGETPLMSLDRRYRKTDNITHKTVIDSVNTVIAPYVGTEITEADNIAVILQTQKDDPRLLVKLSKQTKNFSNKSSVTPTGTLYGNMVDVVTSLDSALLLEDVLEKRRFANAKIKDRRDSTSLVKDNDFTEDTTVRSFRYIYKPLVSRGVTDLGGDQDDPGNFIILNQLYYFFDYEKCLNYETEISSFFNPYNLLQIFGNNALNGYFKIVSVNLEKTKFNATPYPWSATNLDLFSPTDNEELLGDSNTASSYTYRTTDLHNNLLSKAGHHSFFYSQITERAFDTIDSLDGYRLKCYEIVDLESMDVVGVTRATTYVAKIEVRDTTMLFYKEHLQQPILKMYEELKRYLDFAEDFCSFNNIDGRFNDFFIDSVGSRFDSPFPWHEAPLLYYSVLASLEASWQNLGSEFTGFETRKRNGSSVDLTLVKQNAIVKSRQISPETGDLFSLKQFVSDFEKFRDYFEVGSGLDKNNEIYKTLLGGTLSLKRNEISKTFEKTTQVTEELNPSYNLIELSFSPHLSFAWASPLDPTFSRNFSGMQSYLNNVLEEQDDTYSASLDLERLRKKGEGSSYEHRLYFEKGIRWKDMFLDYSRLNSLNPRTKEILQIVFPYLKYLQSLPFSSDLSLSDILPGPLNGEDRS